MKHVLWLSYSTARKPGLHAQESMLSAFHALNLRFVPGKTCKDRMTNEDLFKATGSGTLSSGLNFFRPRCAGHVHRMPRHRIPCVILYGVLKDGTRLVGRPRRQYKDVLKRDLTDFALQPETWTSVSKSRELATRTSLWQKPRCWEQRAKTKREASEN